MKEIGKKEREIRLERDRGGGKKIKQDFFGGFGCGGQKKPRFFFSNEKKEIGGGGKKNQTRFLGFAGRGDHTTRLFPCYLRRRPGP
jgi:hypothetical protein